MKTDPSKGIRFRIVLVGCVFAMMFFAIAARSIYLQVFCDDRLSTIAVRQYERSLETQGRRGTIFDARHRELAVTTDIISIAAYPRQIQDAPGAAKLLARALGIPEKEIRKKLAVNRTFIWIKRHVSPHEERTARELGIKGIGFISEYSRVYPNRSLAAQVVGIPNIDGRGLEGLEFYYDEYLKGGTGQFTALRDALGRYFESEKQLSEINGNNLILTIDQAIQYSVERSVNEAMEKFSAQSAMSVVMNPGTGAVLAMVNVPAFNPNVYQNSDRALWRNRVVTDRYEPGSTMKIFTAAAALESGLCTQNSTFFCENGKYRLGSNTVHDTHEYGWLTLEDIVKVSSNIGATKVGEKIGAAALYQTLDRFGFGQKTGIDCPGETTGSLTPFQQWRKIDAATIAFGQGVSVSAIQLAAAACAIVNDGILMKPYLVQAVTDQHGRVIKGFKPQVVRRVISAQNAGIVRKMMQTVVSEGGTGANAALEGYSIGGKTGTAQKINPQGGGYEPGKYVGSFLGFAPAEKPEIVVLVIIDEPRRFHYGGTVAAPAFRRIVQETLNYLNIPPPGSRERLTVSVGQRVQP